MSIPNRRDFHRVGATVIAGLAWPALATAPISDQAREAFIWGYPIVDLYAILHGQALDPRSPEYKAPLNEVGHARMLASPADTLVIAPNVDTPYSYAWLDLRAGPVVITVPAFEANRYVSLQLIDLYTWIIDYVTPRTNGNAGGDFLLAPPGWAGAVPAGIRKVFRSTTTLALGLFRTQLLGPQDLPGVHALQDLMRVRTLAEYQGHPRSPVAVLPPLVAPLALREKPADPRFFDVLNWMLHFMPVLDDEQGLRQHLQDIGVAPGEDFTLRYASQVQQVKQVQQGMGAALQAMGERAAKVRSSAELFGSRAYLQHDYLTRAVGAMLGILGNAAEEYLGLGYRTDAQGQAFDGRRRYKIRFAPGQLPPVDAFWSITAYTESKLLYANAIDRYVINSLSVAQSVPDADGGFTVIVQHTAPEPTLIANWLPVPAGAFGLTFRSYLPRAEIRDGLWRAPLVVAITPD